MSVVLTCTACGKRLQVPNELAGKRARCSGCGEVLNVPADSPAPPSPSKRSAPASNPPRESEPPIPAPPRIPRLRKKKKKASLARFSLFGNEQPTVRWILLFGVVGAVAAAAVYFGSFLIPGGAPRVAEARAVDVYTAFKVRQPHPIKDIMPGNEPFKVGGGKRFVVVRDNPDGRFLLVRFTVSQKALERKGQLRSGTLSLSTRDVRLHGDGPAGEGLFLTEDFANEGVAVRLLGSKDLADAQMGGDPTWTHDGDFKSNLELRPFSAEDDLIVASGKSEFRGKGGMVVVTDYARLTASLTWDASSRGWLAEDRFERLEQFLDRVEMVCLFPRPASGGKEMALDVLGQRIPFSYR